MKLHPMRRHLIKQARERGAFDDHFRASDAPGIFERYFAQGSKLDLNDEEGIDTFMIGLMHKLSREREKTHKDSSD